jgi:hypothetical protein
MRTSSALRARLIAVLALAGTAFASPAQADEGSISFRVIKAGLVIGGSAGSGTLTFHGQRYALGIGGISYGFTFGASETRFRGTLSNIHSPGTSPAAMPRGTSARPSGAARRRSCSPMGTARCSRSPATRSARSSAPTSTAWRSR